MDTVADAQDALYRIPPDEFVAERDARVARAREDGDRDAATAIAALRRPTRAAWLTNLLVADRPDEVDGLLELAGTLASAQRTLDGAALRQVSAQRTKLVGALSRRAAALGRESGQRVDTGLEREVRSVLEAALADPELAERVRSGRLVRAEQHAGFGPEPDPDASPRPAGAAGTDADRTPGSEGPVDDGPGAGTDPARERERTRRQEVLDRAREAAEQARHRHDAARDELGDAERRRDAARDRVGELIEELDRAREESAAANKAAHSAASAEKEAARAARTADTARDRAAAALDEPG